MYKKYIYVGLILGVSILAAYSEEKVEEEMIELSPTGESRVVQASDEMEDGLMESLKEIESELALVIADQTKLKNSDVTVMLSVADSDEKGNYNLTCTVILPQKDATFHDETINNVVASIMNTISTQDVIKATISNEDIVITNSNNDVLH